jgi:hypothetical protein
MPHFVTLSFLENTTDVIPDVIRRAQHEDIQILKDNYNKLLEKHYKKARQKKLEDLDRFECKIARPELPEFSLDIENNSQSEDMNLKNDVKKCFKLLEILKHKRNCPISQVIDKI